MAVVVAVVVTITSFSLLKEKTRIRGCWISSTKGYIRICFHGENVVVLLLLLFPGSKFLCRYTHGILKFFLHNLKKLTNVFFRFVFVSGCKIKALRAKTNTYIKTPVRGEEPVFVVTGRKEDVAKAKREILSAAEHFSQIRASRKTNLGGLLGGLSPPGPPANIPGQVTIQVRVPYRVVGLVVGPKGATIKRIQQQTHTYIVTPSRDKEPVFEVSGLPENVQVAKREIEAHIAMRTGAGTLNGTNMADLLGAPLIEDNSELLASLYKTGLGSLFSCLEPSDTNSTTLNSDALNMFHPTSLTSSASSGAFSSSGSLSSNSSSSSNGGRIGDLVSIWNSSLERDEGIGESPGFETTTTSSNIWSFPSSASTTGITTRPSPTASASPTDSLASITGMSLGTKRDCLVCAEKEINAALVPCGHNLFCLDCATRLCEGTEPACPICSRTVCQAIRILS